MARILCVGDIHLSHTRLELCKKVLAWIELVSKQESLDAIVYLGDVMDSHSVIRAECLCIWKQHLDSILSRKIPVYWILGNHEQFKPSDATYNALQPFQGWSSSNLLPIVEPCDIHGYGFVPYLNKLSWTDAAHGLTSKILFTHNTFVGADYGFKVSTDGVNLSEISQDLIVSGHIHKRQTLSTGQHGNTKVVYPGTPYAWSANDVNEPKGLMILDTENLQTSFIESPLPLWKKLTIQLSGGELPTVPDSVRLNDHLVVKLIGLRSDIKAFISSEYVGALRANYSSVSISSDFLDSAKSSTGATSIRASSVRESVEAYMKYIYIGSLPSAVVEKEVLKALGEAP